MMRLLEKAAWPFSPASLQVFDALCIVFRRSVSASLWATARSLLQCLANNSPLRLVGLVCLGAYELLRFPGSESEEIFDIS